MIGKQVRQLSFFFDADNAADSGNATIGVDCDVRANVHSSGECGAVRFVHGSVQRQSGNSSAYFGHRFDRAFGRSFLVAWSDWCFATESQRQLEAIRDFERLLLTVSDWWPRSERLSSEQTGCGGHYSLPGELTYFISTCIR